ncbi:DedA family protein [Aliifodinibius sp. S!AR15-10]|uniref:DedA family protein n=1 Tax=Aliifodinibius sp. S!AR15-10 TaxID=2950437 RepID=UPI00286453BE|nr:DedA family protein [Aliifodinibius sp. S!AR15-10]MDR8394098.1 DedA family protein [Aliifodinibius sp. S!AR15-10]
MLEEFTQNLIQWIKVLPPLSIYIVFFLIAYIENVVPPIPGDLLVAFGGYLAAEEVIHLTPVLLLTTVASVIGFMTMYWLGSHWGTQIQEQRERFWMMKFIPVEYIDKARGWMQRWGQGVVLANRFLAGTRSVISLTAGISHTPVTSTIISSAVSSVLWNAILLGFGWVVHKNWRVIGDYLGVYSQIILVIIALFVLLKLGISYYQRRKNTMEDT